MNIVVENGSYHMDNLGDIAMLQVCTGRILERWPHGRVQVVTEAPQRLLRACPGVEPLLSCQWPVQPCLPARWRSGCRDRLELAIDLHWPRLALEGKRRRLRHRAEEKQRLDDFYGAVRHADAVICSGGGFINDWYPDHGNKVLKTLALAQAFDKPTAMFGIGLGPLEDTYVRSLAAPVIRRLRALGLRDGGGSVHLLSSLGIGKSRYTVTGDDAIELVCSRSLPSTPGGGLGVGLRLAGHASLTEAQLRSLGRLLLGLADRNAMRIEALPVRHGASANNDIDALAGLFEDRPSIVDEGRDVDGPSDLVGRIARCSVVVTGAYHAAVFALSQSIPVVALTGDRYYDQKFSGLADLFGGGIELLPYAAPDLPDRLEAAVRRARAEGEERRAARSEAARQQMDASRQLYREFFEALDGEVSSRHGAGGRTRVAS